MTYPVSAKGAIKSESETRERLLDAAEVLFAEHGFDGVGMRALAGQAQVNLGAATYHFKTKENLYIETLMRRFQPTNARRVEMLRAAEAEAGGQPVAVETIIECMLRPPFMTVMAHPNFTALLSRSLFMPLPFLKEALFKEVGPSDKVFIHALSKALPNLTDEVLAARLMFAGGVLLMFSSTASKLHVRSDSKWCETALKAMIQFVAAGFRAESTLRGGHLKFPLPPFPPR